MIFKWESGLIWISLDVEYEGQNYNIKDCIVDTGSATTAIDIGLVDFNYRRPAVIKRLHGVGGGVQEVVSQKVERLVFGEADLENIEIEFGDLQDDFGINGFIGNDVLSRFLISINYSKQEITFELI